MHAEKTYSGPFQFFGKHFNGDYSLARSYWVNTCLLSLFAPILRIVLVPWLSANFSTRYASACVLFTIALGIVAWVWAVSGTWASANKHVARGGKQGWASAAKLMIVLAVLRLIGDVAGMSGALAEHWKVALGWQVGPEVSFQVRADGKSMLLQGGINDGTAEALSKALDNAPSVKTLVLQSGGGWVRQGNMMAQVISKRGLNTYVEGECSSACTIAFLAGKDRSADPKARIGFHSFSSIGGMGAAKLEADTASAQKTYRQAGLAPSFIARIVATPPERLWYPTKDELLTEGIITRVSFGGETATFATLHATREKLSAEFSKTPLFAAMATKYPDAFNTMIDKAWAQVQQKRPDSEVITAAREQLTQLSAKLLPIVDGATLLDFNLLLTAQAEALKERNPQECVELLFPTGRPNHLAALLPKELIARELHLMSEMIRTSDPNNASTVSAQETTRIIRQVIGRLPPEKVQYLASKPLRASSPRATCDVIIAYLGGLNSIAIDQRARSIRAVYASK